MQRYSWCMDARDATSELRQRIAEALSDSEVTQARNNALRVIQNKRATSPIDSEKLKMDFKEVKQRCIAKLNELLPKAVAQLRANGCEVYVVKSEKDLIPELLKILEGSPGDKLVVKSKINTGKEVHLVENLEKHGYEVVETDLGDRIVQLLDSKASHPLLPALQVPKQRVAKLFGLNEPGRDYTTKEIVDAASKSLRQIITRARAGISGANAITAEEGLVCMVENEGNQRLITSIPKIHIVITGIDKIVETAVDAVKVVRAAAYFGLGAVSANYISFIMGPSRTGDIAFEVTEGMHGPEHVHVFLLDNGRQEILASPFKELLSCVSCGGCVNYCPIYQAVGGFYGDGGGARRIIFTGLTDSLEHAYLSGANCCTECGACKQNCPAEIDIPSLMPQFRQRETEAGFVVDNHAKIAENITQFNNPFGESASKEQWIPEAGGIKQTPGAKNLLFIGCMASYRVPQQALATTRLLEFLDIPFQYLDKEEPCCGGVLRRVGFEKEFSANRIKVEKMLGTFKELWVLCPGCYSTFVEFYGDFLAKKGIKVRHTVEILAEHVDKLPKGTELVTFHDSCHLARTHAIVDQPRAVIQRVSMLKEMPKHGTTTQCCGAGAGCMSAFSDLAKNVARYRIQDALATGAQQLLTTCPFCEYNLANAADKKINVTSLQAYLTSKLGPSARQK